jgi:hypothetical protein
MAAELSNRHKGDQDARDLMAHGANLGLQCPGDKAMTKLSMKLGIICWNEMT